MLLRIAASRSGFAVRAVRSYHPGAPYAGGWDGSHPNPLMTYGTTIICVRKDGEVTMIGDGQVSLGSTIVKPNAKKVRRIGDDENILAGFAGATADCLTLVERLERKLTEYPGQLERSCVELAKAWRTDKFLRNLEALLVVADGKDSFTLTGNGDVIRSADDIIGIGSGGTFALSAARALIDQPNMDSLAIATKSMEIAGDICVYTNKNFVIEQILPSADSDDDKE